MGQLSKERLGNHVGILRKMGKMWLNFSRKLVLPSSFLAVGNCQVQFQILKDAHCERYSNVK